MKGLHGVRAVVTRPAAQSEELAQPLRQAGATVLVCPLIQVVPRELDERARDSIRQLPTFDWVVLTSANGVEQLVRALAETGAEPAALRVACVGPVTAAAARRHGLEPAAVPAVFMGEALPSAMSVAGSLQGQRILLARAGGAGTALPELLKQAGADVVELELYRSLLDERGAARLQEVLRQREADLLTFTSGSAVANFAQAVGIERAEGVRVAAIGPSTARLADEHALPVDILASPHTIPGLVDAIVKFYAANAADGG